MPYAMLMMITPCRHAALRAPCRQLFLRYAYDDCLMLRDIMRASMMRRAALRMRHAMSRALIYAIF